MVYRHPYVAGMFYPGQPDTLRAEVDKLLAAAPAPPPGHARMAVSPHAGYRYSGLLAARSIAALAASGARSVIVIGPSHVEHFPFSSVFDGDGYETPLGVTAVDVDLARRIAAGRRTVSLSQHGLVQERLPRGEHSLEVQLPFLQRAIDDLRIVPIVMGEQSWEHCRELGDALGAVIDDDAAVVASSDLSHFYDHTRAEILDSAFSDALRSMDARAIHDAIRAGSCEACGAGPVIAALGATEALQGRRVHVLGRTNSGDVTGDRSSVVGYLSAVLTTEEPAR